MASITEEERALLSGNGPTGGPNLMSVEDDLADFGQNTNTEIPEEALGWTQKLDGVANKLASVDFTGAYMTDLLPLLLSISFLAIVVLWFAINNYKSALVVFIIIPLTISSVGISYFTVEKLLGYPTAGTMTDESLYVSHLPSQDGKWIYVWIVEPESNQPRAIIIPATKNNKKQMDGAKQKSEQGIKTQIKSKGDGAFVKGQRGQTAGGEYEVYDFQIDGGGLKDYEQQDTNAN